MNLQKYAGRLMEYIETHPDFIVPESRKNERDHRGPVQGCLWSDTGLQ